MNHAAYEKFLTGVKLEVDEFQSLELIDKCRYIVTNYFKGKSFDTVEVHEKMIEISPLNVGYTPNEVYNALCTFYGNPG